MSSFFPSTPFSDEKYFLHNEREESIYRAWESAGLFQPENAPLDAPVFSIAMPPPNANGELHIGHSFGYTVKDILGRFHRLLGERVLLIPGKDHAGIQTQVVFEKLLKKEGIHCLSRDELTSRCYDFCSSRASYMRAQEKRIGISADWSRELFTLDPRLTTIIYRTFKSLWDDGLVYKGARIVNWSVLSQTAISDVEVEYREQEGSLWTVLYRMVDPLTVSSGELKIDDHAIRLGVDGIAISTTRPETILGDTALAVHPEDERYRALVGRHVVVPYTSRAVPIIADTRVDKEYGTGVVKITPSHDFLDYDIGSDHGLPALQVIGKDGRMTSEAGKDFVGLLTQEARTKILEKLEQDQRLLSTKRIVHKVPIGERGKDVIEPLISEQWFIAVDKPGNSLKERALRLIQKDVMGVVPDRFRVLFEQWLTQLRDWNISRQLWWGHRIPVWYGPQGEIVVSDEKPEGDGWTPETDVFDTWFSSGQWAFSTVEALGLAKLGEVNAFSPTHTMVMGRDILFFWACRMVLLIGYVKNHVPWKSILFTGLIRDEHGQKMSKSKGNGIDPIDAINTYGADALRLSLVMGATSGQDLSFSLKKIEGYSKFTNKLWNAAKLIEMKSGGATFTFSSSSSPSLLSSRWLLSELTALQTHVHDKLQAYELSISATELYGFTWDIFCDRYLEVFKILVEKGDDITKNEALTVCQEGFVCLLTMLHPYVPYVTEELYQRATLPRRSPFLCSGSWFCPLPHDGKEALEAKTIMESLFLAVAAVRSIKAVYPASSERMRVELYGLENAEMRLLFSDLAKVTLVSELQSDDAHRLSKPFQGGKVICEVPDRELYTARLKKDLQMYEATIVALDAKLKGDFAKFAKPEVIEKEHAKLAEALSAVTALNAELGSL
jgi:valyl-tRNA synthetase